MAIHPAVAAVVVAVDFMLFGGEAVTFFAAWPITGPIGFLVGLAACLFQRELAGDSWALAIAKGLVVGVITAIPTPLPALLTGAAGVAGLLRPARDAAN